MPNTAKIVLASDEEDDFEWINPKEDSISFSFKNKVHNSDEFKINAIWVTPDDSQRTHKLLLDIIARTKKIEIRSILNNNHVHHISEHDTQRILSILSKSSPRLAMSDWSLSTVDDVYIVFIEEDGKEYIMSWDTPILLWEYMEKDIIEYKNIFKRFLHS